MQSDSSSSASVRRSRQDLEQRERKPVWGARRRERRADGEPPKCEQRPQCAQPAAVHGETGHLARAGHRPTHAQVSAADPRPVLACRPSEPPRPASVQRPRLHATATPMGIRLTCLHARTTTLRALVHRPRPRAQLPGHRRAAVRRPARAAIASAAAQGQDEGVCKQGGGRLLRGPRRNARSPTLPQLFPSPVCLEVS